MMQERGVEVDPSTIIKGFEIMRMIRRGQSLTCKPSVRN